jgi:hypothetical protein
MTVESSQQPAGSARPFGSGLVDSDLRLLVASTDVRYRQKLIAVVVRRSADDPIATRFAVELIVLDTPENVAELKTEAHMLDPLGRLGKLGHDGFGDLVLHSATTGERLMVTAMPLSDFERVEQIASLEQIHIGGSGDRGSWVCRLIDAERLDALFGGRFIDIRN